jgi:uncharacterized membrane protein YfhO
LYYWEFPIVIFCGCVLIILSNYIAIKLYNMFEIPVVFVAPLSIIAVVVYMISILPEAAGVSEGCSKVTEIRASAD